MSSTRRVQRALGLAAAIGLAAGVAVAGAESAPSQVTQAHLVTVTGEVVALDLATRQITISGPLGGESTDIVAPEVKNLEQVKVGDLVEISHYQSVAISAHKSGESNPLFEGGDSSTAAPGERPALATSKQDHVTVTVVAVDPETKTLVIEGPTGKVSTTVVERPEFAAKLKTLRAGDKLDIVTTRGYTVSVTPAKAGAKPSVSSTASTLIVERGEVLNRTGTMLMIRNEHGRTVVVTVAPDAKFLIDGVEHSVFDLKPGTKLTRTAFRATSVEYAGGN